jgi:hypothetical protein
MKSNHSLFFVALLLAAFTTVFFSCQRNGGAKTPEAPVVENTSISEPVVSESTAIPDTLPDSLPEPISPNPPKIAEFIFLLTTNSDGTFGYDVTERGKLVISQPNIPGQSGTTGFAKKEQAAAAATLVMEKLEQGIMPPTISEKELKKILKN